MKTQSPDSDQSVSQKVKAIDSKKFQSHLLKITSIPVILMVAMLAYFHFQNSYRQTLQEEIEVYEAITLNTVILEKNLGDMSVSVRGFTISGNKEFLELYSEAIKKIPEIRENIFRLIGGDYELNKSFRSVLENSSDWLEHAAKVIAIRDDGGKSAEAKAEDLAPYGKKFFDKIRSSAGDFKKMVVKSREERNLNLSRVIKLTNILEAVFALLFALFVAYLITRQLKDLTSSYRALISENIQNIERVNASSKAKDLFLANMSHEIRTPLGAIMGFAELISQNKSLDLEAKGHVAFIRRNSEHLFGLIDDLFDLSKMSADKLDVSMEDISLQNLNADLKNTFSSNIYDKKIDLVVRLATQIPEVVKTDPLRLRQILSNLIGNAIKFSPKGSKVEVVYAFRNSELIVDVIDQGIGIEPAVQKVIFEAFTQADERHSRKYGGAGLGLSISKKLAHLLKGDILLVDSRPNVGSHFRLQLPIENYERRLIGEAEMSMSVIDSSVAEEARPDALKFDFSGKKILLAEDAKENQVLFKVFIGSTHADLTIVDNGTDAVRKALNEEYDLVLMDIQMPGLDGYEALKILRDSSYEKNIIALTAHTMKGEKGKCLAAGFDGYLSKPVSQNKLLMMIRDSFGGEIGV